jgi:hypothetical protein
MEDDVVFLQDALKNLRELELSILRKTKRKTLPKEDQKAIQLVRRRLKFALKSIQFYESAAKMARANTDKAMAFLWALPKT